MRSTVGAWQLKNNQPFVFVGEDDGTTFRRLDEDLLMLCLRRITSRRQHLWPKHINEGRREGRASCMACEAFDKEVKTPRV